MSSLEANKILAAILTAGVIAMTSGFIASILFHHEELRENAYQIAGAEGEEAPAAGAAEAGPEPVLPLLAEADVQAGQQAARKCAACHTFEQGGAHKIGPNLYDVVTRPIASAEGFAYSSALQEKSGEQWSYQNLNAFIAKPSNWAPGTKMAFAGIGKVDERANVIGYLRTLSQSPAPLPSAEEVAAAQAPAETAGQTEGEAGSQAAAGGAEIGPLIAAADPEAGKTIARKCVACHTFEQGGANKLGPNLYNVVKRDIAAHEGFNYSEALSGKSGEWTYETLNEFLTDPKGWAPGTKMLFPGLKKPEDRAAVIAYLRQMSENPPPLPQ